jgi:hypothetical protein
MGELLNLVGLSTGVVLYAMLLAMVVRGSRTPGVESRFDSLLLATSILGLVWNLCALPAYELPKVGIQGPFPGLLRSASARSAFFPQWLCIPCSAVNERPSRARPCAPSWPWHTP